MTQQDKKPLPLWRCEFRNSPDKNLIAKFFRAESAQEAMEVASKWHGGGVAVSATLEKE